MLTFYLIAAIVGGVLVGTSMLFGGHGDADHDLGHDHDHDHELGHDHDHEAGDHDHGGHGEGAAFLPFMSLRFWTFFACFFGLTGILLTAVTPLPMLATLAAALAIGGGSGTLVSWVIHKLKASQSDGGIAESELEGATARVLLPVSTERPGRIRVHARGTDLDLTATTHETEPLPRGAEVLVVRVSDGEALVASLQKVQQATAQLEEVKRSEP